MKSETFRAGAGAVILNHEGQVLALERADVPGAWQLPQGGLAKGEAPLAAAFREVEEETGIEEGQLRPVSPKWLLLAYELPEEYRRKKTGRGQVLYWFFFQFEGPEKAITLGNGKEFRDWQWMAMEKLASIVVPFRQGVYQELAEELSRLL